MKLLTKSNLSKLDKTGCKTEFAMDKLTVSPLTSGRGELRFPLHFTCYKFINLVLTAKKGGEPNGTAKVGVSFTRGGRAFGPEAGEDGFISISGEGYCEYSLHFLIPFGVHEASVCISIEGGAELTVLDMSASVDFAPVKKDGEGITCIADGGLSAYAPKNSMSAYLAAIKAGFKRVIVDVDVTADGEFIAYDGGNLSSCSDGDGYPADYTLEQLSELDFGFFSGSFYRNTRVVRLEDAIAALVKEKVSPAIRISVRNFDFEKLSGLLERFSLGGELWIISPDMSTLERANAYFESAKKGYIGDDITADRTERLARMHSFIVAKERPKNMARAEELGIGLVLTVNDASELAQSEKEGVTEIITGVYQLDGSVFR